MTNNTLTYSGDGFFIGNQHSLPSNHNRIEGNDGSYSPNNCFEATFSEGNTFRNNIANNCNYGFWLGFSHHTTVEGNAIQSNRTHGIAWEHGHEGVVSDNRISRNGGYGLWFHLNPTNYDFPHMATSRQHQLTGNTIAGNGQRGVYFNNTTACDLTGNLIDGNVENLYFTGDSSENKIAQNDLLNGKAVSVTAAGKDQIAENNWWGTTDGNAINSMVADGQDDSTKGKIDYDPWLTASTQP